MSYKIVTKYIKDLTFEIFSAKSYFLLEKNIKNHRSVCDIKSKKIKDNIIQVDVNLRLVPTEKSEIKHIDVSVEFASLIQIEKDLDEEILIENVKKDKKISNFLEKKSIFKHIIVKNKLVNLIVK